MGGLVVTRSSGQILALCLLSVLTQVSSTGIFQLKLISFANDHGRNESGQCCSGSTSSDNCESPCRTFFRVCLKHFQAEISYDSDCLYGEVETPVLGNNTFEIPISDTEPFTNPIQMPIDFSWPGTFSLIIEAFHSDAVSPADGIPYPGTPRNLIARLATQRYASVGENWVEDIFNVGNMEFAYSFRIVCDDHYYGPGCNLFCKGRDDNLGHYSCDDYGNKVCLEGWSRDLDDDYCSIPNCRPGCHAENGHCTVPGECVCRLGWQGDLCDECVKFQGCKNGFCRNPYDCICQEGWGGQFCHLDLIFCTRHEPCRNGGTCYNNRPGFYTCTCPAGFTGKDCEIEINDCNANVCLNGGTCQDSINAFECLCTPEYTGTNCEIRVETCQDEPCLNGGACIGEGVDLMCLCSDGYTGARCDSVTEINHCSSSPCENGATCVDEDDGFSCECLPGYYGQTCANHVEYCDPNPCQNGATCDSGAERFYCQCVPGYTGTYCEKDFDECEFFPCSNGGTCSDLLNDYECECPAGFAGKDCSVPLDLCASEPCQNGGTCGNYVNGYECTCPEGYVGVNCEKLTSEEMTTIEVTSMDDATDENEEPDIVQSTVTSTTPGYTIYSTPVATTSEDVSSTEHRTISTTEDVAPVVGSGKGGIPLSTIHLIAIIGGVAVIVPAIILAIICVVYKRRRKSRDGDTEYSKQDNKMNNRRCENDLKALRGKEVDLPPSSISIKVCNEECDSLKKTNREHFSKLKEFENDFKAEKALQQNAQLISHELSSKRNREIAKYVNSDSDSSCSSSGNKKDCKSSKRKDFEQSSFIDYEKGVEYSDPKDSVHSKVPNTITQSTSTDRTSQQQQCDTSEVYRTWKEETEDFSGNTIYILEENLSPRATEV
ncbi:uncharacterized protein LOC144453853 [Glandiceps talaboti]